jgi:hypothetical protein
MGRRERKSEKAKQIVMGVVIALIMILSTFGIIIGSQSNELRYGKFKFQISNNQYVTKINGKEMNFYFLPVQTEYINLSSVVTNKLKEAYMVMMTFNPNDQSNLPVIELVRFDFSQLLGKVVFSGVLNASEDYKELPVLSCANATLQTPVLLFNVSDNTSIIDINNCIYLNARGTEFLRLRDRVLYSYYGVINDK